MKGPLQPRGRPPPGCGAPARRGTDAVGLRLWVESGEADQASPALDPLGGHPRPLPGTPMGPRETARYGLRALRIGRPLTRASPMTVAGTWAAFGMLPLSLKGSPGLTSWWLACALGTRFSRPKGSPWSGSIRRVVRRGPGRLAHPERPGAPGPPPRRLLARMVPLPPRMGVGLAT